jgi:hypothetical protein
MNVFILYQQGNPLYTTYVVCGSRLPSVSILEQSATFSLDIAADDSRA